MPPTKRTNLGRWTTKYGKSKKYKSKSNWWATRSAKWTSTESKSHRNVVFNPHRAAFSYNVAIDYSSEQIVAIGLMNIVCPHYKALIFKNELPGLCCASGQVKLTLLVQSPEPLHSLVSENGPDSNHFLTHIQHYSECFQMTSFGITKFDKQFYLVHNHVAGAKFVEPLLCRCVYFVNNKSNI